ncbi:MAG TPA: STAS domain-containing protein [Acidobacteriaceae bacterium]|jgi:anti-anti-sigma regulatory factor|nr:STAS domain-containing protein [Acidobacteriaceae bacterium]
MTTRKRNVTVKQIPSGSDLRRKETFLKEVEASLAHRRPCLVLDCSTLQELDQATIHLMLHCLEEALKRNGDVKLAALPAAAEAAFTAAGLGRLFELYATAAEAAASFHQAPVMSEPTAVTAPAAQLA